MARYQCIFCDYVYDSDRGDPGNGIAPGIAWENMPDDWVCPLCLAGKSEFEEI